VNNASGQAAKSGESLFSIDQAQAHSRD